MILVPHILIGATIGAKTHNLGLIIILGLLTHFILDKIPHWDYNLPVVFREFRENKKIKPLVSDFVKIAIDITIGLLIVFIIVWSRNLLSFDHLSFILIGIIISILPDVVLGFVYLIPGKAARKINKISDFFHCKDKEKEGKITFPNLTTEILLIIISIIILFF